MNSKVGILDSGISVITFPPDVVYNLDRLFGASWDSDLELYTIDCSKRGSFDDWIFYINGNEFSLTHKEYVIDVSFCLTLKAI